MVLRRCPSLRLPDHGSEVFLLGAIAIGVIILLGIAINRGLVGNGFDVAAFLLVLQRIIEAIQKRWEQRSVDKMGASLANAPPSDPPAEDPQRKD